VIAGSTGFAGSLKAQISRVTLTIDKLPSHKLQAMSENKPVWRSPVVIIGLVVIALAVALYFTNILKVLSFDSESNAPTIPAGHIVLTSRLQKPKLFDFIAFHNTSQAGAPVWLLRICGMPGDSVEIRNGDLLINGQTVDSALTLSHSYLLQKKDTAGLKINKSEALPVDEDRILITYPDKLARQLPAITQRYVVPEGVVDSLMNKVFHEPFNIDHFGPVKVPDHSFFLLGDNRSNALDSHYTGFVDVKDFIGTVIYY